MRKRVMTQAAVENIEKIGYRKIVGVPPLGREVCNIYFLGAGGGKCSAYLRHKEMGQYACVQIARPHDDGIGFAQCRNRSRVCPDVQWCKDEFFEGCADGA